jgi:SAM-dependent methyltransferase
MSMPAPRSTSARGAFACAAAALCLASPWSIAQAATPRAPDVVYVPTRPAVVKEMLDVAHVGPEDVVYDLGCGDGRIVVAAAKRGARRAIGVDIDPERVAEARALVESAQVQDRVRIIEGDLFDVDLRDATVVTLYLLPDLNLRLRPRLLALRPGTRIVSHDFDMGDWKPERTVEVDGATVYFWTVPAAKPAPQARTPVKP